MTDNVKFEIMADAFLRMTGMLAPGKDAREGPSSYTDERWMAWAEWRENNRAIIFHLMNAVEHVLEAT